MRRGALCLVLLVSFPIIASAETYVIHPDGSGDFPSIQAAIDFASDGDIIELTDGTFTGDGNRDVMLQGKAVTMRSQSGNATTCIIDVEGTIRARATPLS
jgi:hypothetical protein